MGKSGHRWDSGIARDPRAGLKLLLLLLLLLPLLGD